MTDVLGYFFQMQQDERDGAALRRLREALPEEEHRINIDPTSDWVTVRVCGPDDESLAVSIQATIAEAADKCREALAHDQA